MPHVLGGRYPFGSGEPPKIPTGTLVQRARAYIHHSPDHWGNKAQLKELRDRMQSAVFVPGADSLAVSTELRGLLDLLDGLYRLVTRAPCGLGNPWWPVHA